MPLFPILINQMEANRQTFNGDPGRIQTYNPLLRRQKLYSVELRDQFKILERIEGIEPSSSAWKAEVIRPIYDIRNHFYLAYFTHEVKQYFLFFQTILQFELIDRSRRA